MPAIIPPSLSNMPSLLVLPRLYRAAEAVTVCRLPLLLQRIPAGFPSPADEYAEAALDLNTYLIRNKTATFFFRVMGDSMSRAKIHDGDLLVVDRSIEPRHGHIVLAVINNEYTVKRLYRRDGVIELHADRRYAGWYARKWSFEKTTGRVHCPNYPSRFLR